MSGLNDFERAVLDKLLAGDHPVLVILRLQADRARVAKRETTGVGFFCEFEVDDDAPIAPGDFHLGDVEVSLEGIVHGAGIVLFVRGRRLKTLEGYTYDEPWPQLIREFALKYSDPERRSVAATLARIAPAG